MVATIRYTVRHHPLRVKKVGNMLCGIAAITFLITNLIWVPFSVLPLELRSFAIIHMIPDLWIELDVVAAIVLISGIIMRRMQWRTGTIEWMNDRIMITGSYFASIRLENIFEVVFRDSALESGIIKLDSKTDAVKIKFEDVADFVAFSNQFVRFANTTSHIKLKT